MNSPLSHYKEKQEYCSKLLSKAPDIYETYKRMLKSQKSSFSNLNTSQASLETINKPIENDAFTKNYKTKYNPINSNISNNSKKNPKNNNIDKPHLSYIGFLKTKGFPFFYKEKRFQWQNLEGNNYPGAINTLPNHRKKFKLKNASQKEFKIKRPKKCVPSALNDMSFKRTKRVIITEANDQDGDYFAKRHKINPNLKKYQKFLNAGEGGMANLINKTPLKFNYKGIRIVKRCNSCDLNLFMKNYAKYQLPRIRKHFVVKDDVYEILNFSKSNSSDYLTCRENKICKFKNKLYINPINWRINHYCDFYGKKNKV